ncbi:hypothetical protein RJ640_010096 [Escallonia rubra]|uniref:Uncharacterized protein n=1 Tax=Escallonia rubra TaxID=112253 RepID=A0AA88UDQ4_9ASTE|nr:hypothetical protein RJ640_010096 [Escallonia rubra]
MKIKFPTMLEIFRYFLNPSYIMNVQNFTVKSYKMKGTNVMREEKMEEEKMEECFVVDLYELEFIHKSSSTVGYRPNVFSTTLSHLIATNSPHLIMPFVPIRVVLKGCPTGYARGCQTEDVLAVVLDLFLLHLHLV